ncbi:SDR family oxidoreductase [Saccharothrix syringae]|uniref:SDR family oxidoreductase n=1 Tax=Saccharothrix syringae TaxID=103733 RepID=A0A5Q0HDS7_SACSY|nr:SDR family oxidoreductase [Saccharothrix syringae]
MSVHRERERRSGHRLARESTPLSGSTNSAPRGIRSALDRTSAVRGPAAQPTERSPPATEPETPERVIRRLPAELDAVAANAAVGDHGPLGAITEEEDDRTTSINPKGTISTVQKALPLLTAGASVVLLSSSAALRAVPRLEFYAATKLAVQAVRRGLVPFLWWVGRVCAWPVARMSPTSKRCATMRFFDPTGRPGPGRTGFGAAAGRAIFVWRLRNPRRTRAGVSLAGSAGRSQGWRRSATSGRARRSWVWAARISQVQRSAASGSRNRGRVQPRVCLSMRKVCSMSKRRRNICHQQSTRAASASTAEHHNQTGLFTPPLGSRSTVSRMTVPSMIGSGAVWSIQAARRVRRGCSRFHACAVAVPTRGGVGRHSTRSDRIRPSTRTGRSANRYAMRGAS